MTSNVKVAHYAGKVFDQNPHRDGRRKQQAVGAIGDNRMLHLHDSSDGLVRIDKLELTASSPRGTWTYFSFSYSSEEKRTSNTMSGASFHASPPPCVHLELLGRHLLFYNEEDHYRPCKKFVDCNRINKRSF
ncbi:hypothetical protein B296_00022083 [Ensete ventricosum]|uniref:Uncharacterized protein n=1 Tax=Ensete ventricosum TaxID=4639 RepID=A0A426YXH8_ENSVE|nr:hypothetical protein B296_00022083 [Ensete ventricosum]